MDLQNATLLHCNVPLIPEIMFCMDYIHDTCLSDICKWISIAKYYKATPLQALRLPEVEAPRIYRQLAHEGSKVVSPTHRPPLPPRTLISVRGWVKPRAIVWPEWSGQWKIPMTPLVIQPKTFQHVSQCLNQLRHHVLLSRIILLQTNVNSHPQPSLWTTQLQDTDSFKNDQLPALSY
jgi:hypothetical protein